jgi:DeoR family transcriptional regulator, ulaG and ulaABCDEF operon transcriptional repressor
MELTGHQEHDLLADKGRMIDVHERERWQVIKALLRERSLVRIGDACRATGASEATVRRDFASLAEQGVAIRVHGGLEALPDTANARGDVPSLATRSFDVSQTLNIDAKRAIAKSAVALCTDGETIIINGGTTTYQMGEYLRERRLKVLTNSYPLAEILIHHSKCRVALPGGEVYREQGMIVSPFEEDAIQHYSATRMFMSAISIGPLGVIEGDPLLARAESKLLKRADKLIVLADSSKFVSRGSLVVCPLSRIHTLVTDSGAPSSALDMLRDNGVQVVVVEADAEANAAA